MMLEAQFPFLPPVQNRLIHYLPQVFIALYVLMSLIWAFSTNATWDDDCPTRAYGALHAFSDPIQFISPWNRPLFILIFAGPVQFGFWTIPVLMTLISAGSAWLLYKAVSKFNVPNAAFVIPLFLFQTYPFVISHNALTEPLAMAIIAVGFWAMVEEKWAAFGVLGGLLVLARLELILLLPIWAFILFRAKQWLPIAYLVAPFVLWNLAGGLMTGDWTYVFSTTIGAAGEESRYGATPFEHYFLRYIYVTGPIVLLLAMIGLTSRLANKRINLFLDGQYVLGFMIYVVVSGLIATGNSAGFLRNLIPITPLAALLATEGLNVFLNSANAPPKTDSPTRIDTWIVLLWAAFLLTVSVMVFNVPLKMHMIPDDNYSFYANAVFIGALLAAWLAWNSFVRGKKWANGAGLQVMAVGIIALSVSFTALAEPPGANDSPEREIVEEIGKRIQPLISDGSPLYVNHIWYFWTQGEDPLDQKRKSVTMQELDAAPEGSIVFWDLHYSPRLGGDVRHEYFDLNLEWTELLRYRSVEGSFMAMVFRKGKRNQEDAFRMSQQFLQKNPDLAAAYSAAGNLHSRWRAFPEAIQHFQRALQLAPQDPDIWFSMGLAELSLRNLEKAEAALLESQKYDPLFPSVWFHLGTIHASMGRFEDALNELTRCIELKPDYADAYFVRATCFARQNRLDAAIADFSRTLELNPKHKEAKFNRGATYAMVQRHDLAVLDLKAGLQTNPNNEDGWLFLGRSQMAMQQIAEACASFQKAASLGNEQAIQLQGKYCQSQP